MAFDVKEIQKQFNEVIAYSQHFNFTPNTDELFETWQTSKQFFIDKFGGLIWEDPDKICLPLDEGLRKTKLQNFIDTNVLYYYQNYDLARFLNAEEEGFFDNIVVDEYRTQAGEIVPKGMKIVKAFKYFEEDKTKLDDLQTRASMLIQENKIEGRLCLSVHPLDFISASENKYHWHSCHALDGEYRSGNLSYMSDKGTIMCYIKGDEDVVLPDFPPSIPWNNKKWRMWLFLADEHNAMMAGRQYPFSISSILDYIKLKLFNLLNYHDYNWTKWHNQQINEFTFNDTQETVPMNRAIPVGGYFQPITKAVTDAGRLHYDDLLYSSCYIPYYCWRTSTKELVHFTLGAPVKCLKCGNEEIVNPYSFVGSECWHYDTSNDDDYDYCSLCGERHHIDDMYWVGDDHLCWRCVEQNCVECVRCGELMYAEDAYWSEEDQSWCCRYCYNRRMTERTGMDANV